MTRWSRLLDHLLGQPAAQTTPTTEPQETPMAPSTTEPAARRLDKIREEIAALDTAADNDPVSLAEDLDGWATRDSSRRTRRLQLEQQLRGLTELGGLADHPELAALATEYTTSTAGYRRTLAGMRFGDGPDQDPKIPANAPSQLGQWCRTIRQLAKALPVADFEPAAAFVDREWSRWTAARMLYFRLLAVRAGIDVPHPEDDHGQLPGGAHFGVYRRGDA